MDADQFGSRRERSEDRYRAGSPVRQSTEGDFDDSEEYDKDRSKELTKHRSKDKKKSRREDKDHRSKDRDRSKLKDELKEKEPEKDFEKERISIKEKRKEEKEELEKDRTKDKGREKGNDRDKHRGKDHDRDRDRDEKDRGRRKDRERERDNEPESNRGREKDRGKEKSKEKEEREKEKAKDRDRGKDRERDKEKERTRDRERERDHEKNKGKDLLEREQVKDTIREREREVDHEKERSRDKEKVGRRSREDQDHSKDGGRDTKAKKDGDDNRERETSELGNMPLDEEGAGPVEQRDHVTDSSVGPSQSRMEVAVRILRMKEERLKKMSDGASEILSWVHKSRKLEEKSISEKEKALQRSKILEEQDNLDEDDNELDTKAKENADALAGVKVLHGIDKVLGGGSVVLTLKDQDILANGDLNEDVDMLENVEIGEQKRRSEAYKAAKNSSGMYVDKFNDEPGEEKKMLPQYDDPAEEEGVVLDAAGRFAGEAEKKLEELRGRLQGPPMNNQAEDLNASVRISSDYFTPEEMLQFRKPKKKKSLRKKEKLDLDALEAEDRITGLGASDLGSRGDSKRQAAKEEEERCEADRRKSAYQAAFSKADEASRALRMEQVAPANEENDTLVFADDAEDLQMSLERTRKLALKKQNEKTLFGPEAVARLASLAINNQATDAQNSTSGDAADNKVVFTEMEEFVWGLQLDEEAQRPYDDVFMEEDEAPKDFEEKKDETGGWSEVVDSGKDEQLKSEDEEDVVPDETLHEVPVGKGLSGVLKLLKDRGTLKETIEWGGRNMDKKKSKLVGIHDEGGPKQIRMDKKKGKLVDEVPKEINLERLDEFGRVLTPKQAFRLLSHKFHGKGPGKMKQEKRMKQYHDELKQKQMTSTDVIPQSVDRMREAQAQLKTPYLVLSGHVKPGQTSDPRSGFATVKKEVPGSLTPMLGDKKVEHFLGIKRKGEPGSHGTPKKPKN